MLTDKQREASTFVESIPEDSAADNERAILYYSSSQGFYYEYEVIE
jgi:hypothetical protein